jgi:hypothetical protein
VKFLFALPLLAVLLVAFRNNKGWYQDARIDGGKTDGGRTDTIKPPARIEERRIRDVKLVSIKEFYKRNPSVKEVAWSDDDEIIIYLKNGQRETYSLDDKEAMRKFETAYGAMPSFISKSLAPIPPAPAEEVIVDIPVAPVKPPTELIIPPTEPVAPNLPKGVNSLELSKNVITVKRADGTTETYNLTKPAEKAAAEKKYGPVIQLIEVPVISKPAAPVKPAVIEVPAKPKTEPVIKLNGTDEGPASVQVVQNANTNVVYADEIVIHDNERNWNVKASPRANPVYYLNGKKAIGQNPEAITRENTISHAEIISDKQILAVQAEKNATVIINLISKENTHNKSVYLGKGSVRTMEEAAEEATLRNTLYIGIENPININVEGVTDENIIVTMPGGQIRKKDGKYFALPTTTGNVEILIYKKEGASLKLINKRVFRAIYLPNEKKLNT